MKNTSNIDCFTRKVGTKQMKMVFGNGFIFPGHKYLGPGNKMDIGPPIDTDDLIAQQHDFEYENALDKENIHRADKKAIAAFVGDCIKNKNWHSALGALCIGFKHLIEVMCCKIFYPKLR